MTKGAKSVLISASLRLIWISKKKNDIRLLLRITYLCVYGKSKLSSSITQEIISLLSNGVNYEPKYQFPAIDPTRIS